MSPLLSSGKIISYFPFDQRSGNQCGLFGNADIDPVRYIVLPRYAAGAKITLPLVTGKNAPFGLNTVFYCLYRPGNIAGLLDIKIKRRNAPGKWRGKLVAGIAQTKDNCIFVDYVSARDSGYAKSSVAFVEAAALA
ncbi:MAG: hypothetical protein LBQ14_06510 [Treponema sp.]|jgi:hypothetical protein|nr:hypothetical protein [Treponema sp.]